MGELLEQHGTALHSQLKAKVIVDAAIADLRLQVRKYDGYDRNAPYSFHRRHVRKAQSARELIELAIRGRNASLVSGKRTTRTIYANAALLQAALDLACGVVRQGEAA